MNASRNIARNVHVLRDRKNNSLHFLFQSFRPSRASSDVEINVGDYKKIRGMRRDSICGRGVPTRGSRKVDESISASATDFRSKSYLRTGRLIKLAAPSPIIIFLAKSATRTNRCCKINDFGYRA